MKGEPRLSFKKLGHLLKAKGIVGKHRVPLWEIALGLVLYQLGLSFRKTAEVLGLLGKEVSRVAVWYWNRKVRRLGQFKKLAPFLAHSSITSSWTTGVLCV